MMKQIVISVCLTLLVVSCSRKPEVSLPVEANNQSEIYIIFEKEVRGDIYNLKLNEPLGLAVDFRGNIFVADAGNDRIIKFDSLLSPLAQLGGYGSQDGSFNYPTYLAFDNGLNLLVSDEQNRRISRFNSHLSFVDNLVYRDDDDLNKFGFPSGIASTNYGELWVADRQNNQIAIFNNIGSFDQILGDYGYAGGQLKTPENIRKDNNGQFMVCDAGNQRVIWYDEYGNYEDELRSKQFVYVTSIYASKEYYYIVDSDAGVIYLADKKKQLITKFGPRLPGDSFSLKQPTDIYLLPDNKLLITDTGNNRLVLGKIYFDK